MLLQHQPRITLPSTYLTATNLNIPSVTQARPCFVRNLVVLEELFEIDSLLVAEQVLKANQDFIFSPHCLQQARNSRSKDGPRPLVFAQLGTEHAFNARAEILSFNHKISLRRQQRAEVATSEFIPDMTNYYGSWRHCGSKQYEIRQFNNANLVAQNDVAVRIEEDVVVAGEVIPRVEHEKEIAAGRMDPVDANVGLNVA